MDSDELVFARGVLVRLGQAAGRDPQAAQQIRDLIAETGILGVFGSGEEVRPLDLLEAGGVALLRTQLAALSRDQLKRVVAANGYDPDRATLRWRTPARYVELIVDRAIAQMEERDREILARQRGGADGSPPAGNSWML